MEETDISRDLDEMLNSQNNHYSLHKEEQNYVEQEIHEKNNIDHDNTDNDTDGTSIIMKVQKKIDTDANHNIISSRGPHGISESEVNELKKELGIVVKELETIKKDMGKIVNMLSRSTEEIKSMKHRIEKMESKSGDDDKYGEYIDKILSVNLDKIKMKLKKSLKKSLLDQ